MAQQNFRCAGCGMAVAPGEYGQTLTLALKYLQCILDDPFFQALFVS